MALLIDPLKVALATGVVIIGLCYLYYLALPKPIPGIPYHEDSSRSIMGDVPKFAALEVSGERPREFWVQLARSKASPITQFFPGPFTKPSVVITDYREAKDLLSRRAKEFDRGSFNNSVWSGAIPHHFIAMDTADQRFAPSRALQKDLMTPTFLQKVSAPSSYKHIQKFISLWQLKAQLANGQAFIAIDDLNLFTADMIFAAALGIEESESNLHQYIQSLQHHACTAEDDLAQFPDFEPDMLLQSILTLALAIGKSPTAPSQKLYWIYANRLSANRKAQADRKRILQKHIDRARQRYEPGETRVQAAVDYMVRREMKAAENEGRPPVLDTPQFHDMLFGYCMGGQDTTHSVLSFMMKQLSRNQVPQRRLRQSLWDAHKTARQELRNPAQEEIVGAQVPYLDAFIEEVLRLDSPAPVIIKQTLANTVILGRVIPKGTQIFFPLWGPSIDEPAFAVNENIRSESSQKHAQDTPNDWTSSSYPGSEFHPERWLQDGVFNSKAGPFLTFSTGNRDCWGKRLAYLQLKLVTTLLIWNFEFLPVPESMSGREAVDILNAKPKTCVVRLKNIR